VMPTALDNGQRSTRKQLAAVMRRVLYALRWSRKSPKAHVSGWGDGGAGAFPSRGHRPLPPDEDSDGACSEPPDSPLEVFRGSPRPPASGP
jgi:hypothetical protein